VMTDSAKHPVWTHTRNAQVNHELDSLHVIYDTILQLDGTNHAAVKKELSEFIRKRSATVRIGAIKGWSAVPQSELAQDFAALGVKDETAAHLATMPPNLGSFRNVNSNPKSGKGKGKGKKKKSGA